MEYFREIKIEDLQCEDIHCEDLKIIKVFMKRLSRGYTTSILLILLFMTLMGCIIGPSFCENLEAESNMFDYALPTMCLVIMYAVSIFSLKSFIDKKKKLKIMPPDKIQYGILREKYIIERVDRESREIYHYCDVIFPKESKIIKKVMIQEETFNDVNEGAIVIVVSFDGEDVYCIKSTQLSNIV